MIKELLAAMAGTLAFSVLFGVPGKNYISCGVIGMAGWLVYQLMRGWSGEIAAVMAATIAVVLCARLEAVRKQCPVTLFLVPGIFPLVPGAGIYLTVYYLVTEQLALGTRTGYAAVKSALALVLGIVLAFEIPEKVFHIFPGGGKYS